MGIHGAAEDRTPDRKHDQQAQQTGGGNIDSRTDEVACGEGGTAQVDVGDLHGFIDEDVQERTQEF